MPTWERLTIETPDGPREAVAPVIVSASRATDLPAFHLDWFEERLRAGFTSWRNPFNGRESFVAFARARAIVFWTKNGRPLLDRLAAFAPWSFYVTCTVNDYEAEGLEPGVPPLAGRLATFVELARQLGRARVVWRFDPLLRLPHLGVPELLARVERIGEQLHPWTEKLVFSLADIEPYPAVARRLARAGVAVCPWSEGELGTLAAGLAALGRRWGLAVAACGEAYDFTPFGIARNRCIDDDLLHRAFPDDTPLQEFLGYGPSQGTLCKAPGAPLATAPSASRPSLKDKGQRKTCGCIRSKDIGRYNTCSHGCLYCYATTR